MCVCLVGQSCLTLCDPMDCSLPGFSDHGNSPGKNTGVDCHVSFRGSSQPKDWTQVSRIAAQFFTIWINRETQSSILSHPSSVKWKLLSPVWLFGTPWTIQSRPDTGMGSLSILQGSSQPGDQPRSPTFSSVQFSLSVMSNSLRPHELQHARPPCPSPTPGVYPNPCPLSLWCHPTISSFVAPFSSHLQSFPESVSFQMSQLFPSGGQSIGASDSISVLPVNTQDWFPLEWTGWISLQSKGLSRVFSNTTVQKHQFCTQLSL